MLHIIYKAYVTVRNPKGAVTRFVGMCKMKKKRRTWKVALSQKLYCNVKWNKIVVCVKDSLDEVSKVLNSIGRKC